MNILLEIKNWLIRILIVLISFSFFIVPSISISAKSINCEYEYSNCSSIGLKISWETSFKVIENGSANTCKSESDLVDYRTLVISSKANAAKGGVQYTKSSLKLGQEMHQGIKKV